MSITITDFPKNPKTSEPFVLKGTATDVDDGDDLDILVDKRFNVANPVVRNGEWQASLIFNQGGTRLIEVIASDQDKAEITLNFNSGSVSIIRRSTWGARNARRGLTNLPNPKRITIHHTVTQTLSASASTDTEESRMRDIQKIHQDNNGWTDIGYHYIIMPSGRVYEGRPNSKRGAHDVINDGFGVAFDGSFHLAGSQITDAQFNSAVALCTQLCKKIGISDPITPVSTPIKRDGKTSANLPRIIGHRDRFPTACPGMDKGTSVRLEDIRQAVRQNLS